MQHVFALGRRVGRSRDPVEQDNLRVPIARQEPHLGTATLSLRGRLRCDLNHRWRFFLQQVLSLSPWCMPPLLAFTGVEGKTLEPMRS